MLETLLVNSGSSRSGPVISVEATLPAVYENAAVGVYNDMTLVNFGGIKAGAVNNELRYYQSGNKQMVTHSVSQTAKDLPLGCMVRDNFYVLGGVPGVTEFRRWNWISGRWYGLAAPPRSVYGSSLVHYNGFLYMAGVIGSVGAPLLRYEISQNTWASLGIMPFSMIYGRMVEVDGRLFFLGGFDYAANTRNGKCYVYNITAGTWSAIAPFLYPVAEHAAVSLDGQIYVMGGVDNASKRTKKLQIYDPLTNTWRDGGEFGPASTGAQAAVMEGKIYLWGGTERPALGENLKMHTYKP